VEYQTTTQAYEGQCTGVNSNQWTGNELCMQQNIPGTTSGIIILDSWNGEKFHRSPQYNYTEPAICDFMLGVKSSLGLYFLSYSSDSLSQQEIFAENPHFFTVPVNISQWPGNDRNPQFFVTFVDYYLMRVHLLWESDREGFSTIYRTYLDYIFGGIDETPKAESLLVSPCPFDKETIVTFPSEKSIIVDIFDLQGQCIKSMLSAPVNEQMQKAAWDGTNNYGSIVPSGSYLVVARAGNAIQSRIVIKK